MLMLKTATVLEAISKRRRTARPAARAGMSKNIIFAATHSAEDALVLLDATADGLTAEHAAERLNAVGPNTIEAPTKTLVRRIADAFVDPSPASSPRSRWSRSTSTCSPCPSRSATPPRSSSSASCCWYRAA